MRFRNSARTNNCDDENSLDSRVHFALIKSLYMHRSSLYFGFFAQSVATLINYAETRDLQFVISGLIHALIITGRIIHMRGYDEDSLTNRETASSKLVSSLENRYVIGSALSSLSLGTQAAYANFFYPASVSAFVTFGIILATLLSVTGRNFGSSRNVTIIILCLCTPLLFSLLINTNGYLQLASVLIPFAMISARQFAGNVRSFLYTNIVNRLEIQSMAEQFDMALNNMPNGLIMITDNGKISVINSKARQILDLPDGFEYENRNLETLIRLGLRNRRWRPSQKALFDSQISRLLRGIAPKELVCFENGVALEISISHRTHANGKPAGAVLIFEDVSSRIEAQEKVRFLAHHDVMTSLPNRGHLATMAAEAVSQMTNDQTVAFCLFDIDRFKVINDTLGHDVGDKVIVNIAKKMSQIDDERMICARVGGDEFVLMFHSLEPNEDVALIFDAAFGNICSPAMIGNKVMNVRCSAGVSVYRKDTFKLDEALIRSDIALYESKKNVDIIWTLFNKQMDEEFRATQQTQDDLLQAVRDGDFKAVYQPMYTPDGRRIECCEALARWEHPILGRISPAVFIQMAEGMRVIGDITRQILYTACTDCMTWPEHISVSVNLSALDLMHDDIVELISGALEATGLPPHRLQVEVTETALVENRSKVAERLQRIKNLGVKTALDDFGTGYSSLSYLNELPLDKIKIDRSFVVRITEDEKSHRMFKAIVQMSREIGFEIVVEGVEGEDQLQMINSMSQGVDLIQGFIFGPPMQADQIAESSEKLRMLPINANIGAYHPVRNAPLPASRL